MKTFLERDLPVSLKTLGLLNQEDDGGMQQLFENAAAELTPLLKVELHSSVFFIDTQANECVDVSEFYLYLD